MWRRGRGLLRGETNAVLTLPNVAAGTVTNYTATIYYPTALGPVSVVSSNALLTIRPALAPQQ